MTKEKYNEISKAIIGAAIEVHKTLGAGLIEKYYGYALVHELKLKGYKVETEKYIPFKYKDLIIKDACRADLIVEDSIIVELKATENDNSLYTSQLLTYLKMSNMKLGLVLNFSREKLINGIERVINGQL
ncbi:MAG: GxxExxY protein [Muribaculaceae bacterium]|nr:GxxExxY protein [Muribaculaceae bacterium]